MILCVGGTPAVQRTLRFSGLELGGVEPVTAAGKAVNVARVVSVVGGRALLITFLGGDPAASSRASSTRRVCCTK